MKDDSSNNHDEDVKVETFRMFTVVMFYDVKNKHL